MQTHKSQQFRNVLQNPVEPEPIFTWLLRAAHSWFNQVKSLFGGQKCLLRFTVTQFNSLHRLTPRSSNADASHKNVET